MSYIRLHPKVKAELEYLAGEDFTMNDLVEMLLQDFYEYHDDDDDDQSSILDFDE